MRPNDVSKLIGSGTLADFQRSAEIAEATIGRHPRMVELAEQMNGPNSPVAKAAEVLRGQAVDDLGADLRAARERLAKQGAELRKRETFDLNPIEPPRRSPLPLPTVRPLPEPGSLRPALLELIKEGNAESAKREAEMTEAVIAMRAALLESNAREAESLKLAKDAERREAEGRARETESRERAERRERYMLAMTAGSFIVGAVAAAVAIF